MRESMLYYLEAIEGFFKQFLDDNSIFKSLELHNFNDDYVIYISIYILAAIFLFIICTLTNFYRLNPTEVIYFTEKPEKSSEKKSQ
jgi:hypothetical protein